MQIQYILNQGKAETIRKKASLNQRKLIEKYRKEKHADKAAFPNRISQFLIDY